MNSWMSGNLYLLIKAANYTVPMYNKDLTNGETSSDMQATCGSGYYVLIAICGSQS